MPDEPRRRGLAWALFDDIVAGAPTGNPWTRQPDGVRYRPDLRTLGLLLAVPLHLGASTQSGVPALALDVWVAHELRRAGLDEDAVWPRPMAPRVLPVEVLRLVANLPASLRSEVSARLLDQKGLRGVGGSAANILGKNYVKQVDVGLSTWQTGPQLLVSTKRMDTALGKNAANRVEESYGDAKNLRARYPRAALGFVYGLRGDAMDREGLKAAWLIDLLGKLGEEDDAYDAVMLLVPELPAEAPAPAAGDDGPGDAWPAAGLEPPEPDAGSPADDGSAPRIDDLEAVQLRHGAVPDRLAPGRFFEVLLGKVLGATPVDFHQEARALHRSAGTEGP